MRLLYSSRQTDKSRGALFLIITPQDHTYRPRPLPRNLIVLNSPVHFLDSRAPAPVEGPSAFSRNTQRLGILLFVYLIY